MLSLTACGGAGKDTSKASIKVPDAVESTVTSTNETEPEGSVAPENTETEQQDASSTEDVKDTKTEESQASSVEVKTVKTITLCTPNEDATGFNEKEYSLTNTDSDEITLILDALKATTVIPTDTEVNEFTFDGDTAYIDLTAPFSEELQQQGTTGEYEIMGSLVNSIIKTFNNIDYVKVTVDGKTITTGHVEYTDKQGLFPNY